MTTLSFDSWTDNQLVDAFETFIVQQYDFSNDEVVVDKKNQTKQEILLRLNKTSNFPQLRALSLDKLSVFLSPEEFYTLVDERFSPKKILETIPDMTDQEQNIQKWLNNLYSTWNAVAGANKMVMLNPVVIDLIQKVQNVLKYYMDLYNDSATKFKAVEETVKQLMDANIEAKVEAEQYRVLWEKCQKELINLKQ